MARDHQPSYGGNKGQTARGLFARPALGGVAFLFWCKGERRPRRLVGPQDLHMRNPSLLQLPAHASGQTEVLERSLMRNREGSSLLPVPMQLIIGTPASLAR